MRWSSLVLVVTLGAAACEASRERAPSTPVTPSASPRPDAGAVGDGGTDAGTSAPDAGPAVDCTGVMPVAGLAARCCRTFGIDACGPGLYCAALDGRMFHACYPEHGRADGQSCTDDVQCLSYACAADTGVCRGSPGAACTAPVGCGPGPSGARTTCVGGTCRVTTGAVGQPCASGLDCNLGYCVAGACTDGAVGEACVSATDCASGRCVRGLCTSGAEGALCGAPSDCDSGYCVGLRCTSGAEGADCRAGTDCASGLCVDLQCSGGGNGRPCTSLADCAQGLECVRPCPIGQSCTAECSDGAAGSPCGNIRDCAGGAGCAQAFDGSWSCGGLCAGSMTCTDGYVCSGSRVCVPAGAASAGATCTADGDCASAVCASFGVGGMACSGPGGYWSSCRGSASCAAGYWCEDSSGSPARSRCVPAEGSPCRRFHDSVEIWSATCHSAIGRCGRYLHARCEGTTTSCRVDADCGAARCIVTHGCGF